MNILPGHLELVARAMNQVVNHPNGTARRSETGIAEFPMAGKTGTVQVRRISKLERDRGVRKNNDLPWRQRDHALFVAFAPVENPRYAISVVVEHGGGGSSTAAPIARDILVEAYRRHSAGPGVAIASSTSRREPAKPVRRHEEQALQPTQVVRRDEDAGT